MHRPRRCGLAAACRADADRDAARGRQAFIDHGGLVHAQPGLRQVRCVLRPRAKLRIQGVCGQAAPRRLTRAPGWVRLGAAACWHLRYPVASCPGVAYRVVVPLQNSTQGPWAAVWLEEQVRAGSRFVSLRLLYLIMIPVFGWLLLLGRRHPRAEIMVLHPRHPEQATGRKVSVLIRGEV